MSGYRFDGIAWCWQPRFWQLGWCRPDDGSDYWWLCCGPLALVWERA